MGMRTGVHDMRWATRTVDRESNIAEWGFTNQEALELESSDDDQGETDSSVSMIPAIRLKTA